MLTANSSPHLLQRIGLVDAPEGMVLRSADLSLRGLFPWWLGLLMLVLVAGLAGVFYAFENAKLGVVRRAVLAVLRTALVAVVLMMLLRPVLLAEYEGNRQRAVVLLVDISQSMGQADRRVTDADKARIAIAKGLLPPNAGLDNRDALKALPAAELRDTPRMDLVKAAFGNEQLDLLTKLKSKGPLQVQLFHNRLVSIRQEGRSGLDTTQENLLAELKPEGAQTALGDAIHSVLTRLGGDKPAAVVVVTDGRDNASKLNLDEAARACRDQGVALHLWGVGSAEAGSLRFKDVRVPATVFIDDAGKEPDDPVEVKVRYRVRGFAGKKAMLTVRLGDQEINREVTLKADGDNLEEIVRFTPNKAGPGKSSEGERIATVSLKLKSDDTVGDSFSKPVQVKKSRVKVLYVENKARREYLFIQPVLNRDRRVLTRIYLVEGDKELSESGVDKESGLMYLDQFPSNFPDADAKDPDKRPYDMLILGDTPYKALGDKAAQQIKGFVERGGGLAVLAGRDYCPTEYVGTPLEHLLPVVVERQVFTPEMLERLTAFRPVLTYDGEKSDMMALADDQEENLRLWREELWKDTPGFEWYYPVQKLRPGATTLLAHPEKRLKSGDLGDRKLTPIIATQYFGRGEVFYLGTDETWRWRTNTGDRLTARFWGQVVARLGLPHLLGDNKRSRLELERGEPTLGRPSGIRARLLDSQYKPVLKPEVKATLVNLDAKDQSRARREVLLKSVPGQSGEYRASLPNDVAGRHELRLEEKDGLEGTILPYRVDLPPRHEMEEAGLDVTALSGAAATGGGALFREEDLHKLADAIQPRTTEFTQRQEVLLWGWPGWLAFVLLITAEWVLRKFSNLS